MVLIGMALAISTTVYTTNSTSHSVSDTLIAAFPFVSLIIAFTMFVATTRGALPKFGQ